MALYNSQSINSGITKTITVYSAASDTVSFTDLSGSKTVTTDSRGEGSVSINYISGMVITFTSSVAKNPDNLSTDYSKTIEITDDTTAIYVMPDDVCYWWGYKSSNYEVCSTSNGWSDGGGRLDTPTEYTNYILCNATASTSGSEFSAIAFKTAQKATRFKAIKEGVSGGPVYGTNYACPTKQLKGITPIGNATTTSIGLESIDVSSLGSMYFACGTVNTRSCKVYAFWLENDVDGRFNAKADKTDIAPVENGTTASRDYVVGQQFYLSDGNLYRAKTAIAQGAQITIGTNSVLASSITDQIKALWDAINS